MPRPCAVEVHVRCYKNSSEKSCGCHGLVPWRFTFAATKTPPKRFADATALCRGGSRFVRPLKALSVKLHGTRPWHLGELRDSFVAASVKLHGTRPWHPNSSLHTPLSPCKGL